MRLRGFRFFLGTLSFAVGTSAVWAAPTPGQVLGFKPRQDGIDVSTPTAQEEGACKVELVKGTRKGSGWLLRDARGQALRRFFDSNDDNKIDLWSYYKDGVEVYREIDTNFNGKADQYRWLNSAGMKWGTDDNEDGKIDGWKMISAEEASQEIVQALVKKDYARLQALLITEAELKTIELPAAEATRIRDLQGKAAAKFQATLAKLTSLSEKTHWTQLQTAAPQCLPTDQTGAKQDVLRHSRGTIMIETAGKDEWLQTGEMIQVGLAWRLVDAPTVGMDERKDGAVAERDPDLEKLFEALNKHDEKAPKGSNGAGPDKAMVTYNLGRADILERVIGKVKPTERESWIRQLADCLSAAAQSSEPKDKTASQRLKRLEEQLVSTMPPGHALAAYVTYREMQADYAAKLQEGGEKFDKVQAEWLDRLAKFVQTYPKTEDTADALLQLGWVSEMVGKENEAKKWYEQLVAGFSDKPLAIKARGALRRLDLEGKALDLRAPVLGGGSEFDVAKLTGKVVIVYYWASWNTQCVGDFAKLKLLLEANSKNVDLVCVNLDSTTEEAQAMMKKTQAPGVHLFTPGGLEGKLATDYGVMMLPNLFLIGKDGKVINRTVQVNGLEAEVQKALK